MLSSNYRQIDYYHYTNKTQFSRVFYNQTKPRQVAAFHKIAPGIYLTANEINTAIYGAPIAYQTVNMARIGNML